MPSKRPAGSCQREREVAESPAKAAKRVAPEKRLSRYRSRPSASDQTRIERAMSRGLGISHRLYLIERHQLKPPGGEEHAEEEFVVLGATGNVYTATIGRQPSCTCPDAAKGNICKHRFFVMLKVLKVEETDPVLWQGALLKDELERVFAAAAECDANALASATVRSRYATVVGKSPEDPAPSGAAAKQPEGDCPICFEPLEDAASAGQEALLACGTCHNHVHVDCMDLWTKQRRQMGERLTCVMCRAPWAHGTDSSSVPSKHDAGYLNLAQNQDEVPDYFELYGSNSLYGGSGQSRRRRYRRDSDQ